MHLISPAVIAPFFARVLLGILFLAQGYDKIFKVKIKEEILVIRPAFKKIYVPDFIIKFGAYFTSYAEFSCGLFLILGILKYFSLYFLGIDLIIVAIGMSVLNPVWNLDLVFPRFILLLFLLIYPAENDVLMLQNLFIYFN